MEEPTSTTCLDEKHERIQKLLESQGTDVADAVDFSNNQLTDEDVNELPLRCKHLAMRKNRLHYVPKFLEGLARELVELDLYDNKIIIVASVSSLQKVQRIDLSYNQIRIIEGFDALGLTLQDLYLCENKISQISGLENLVHLRLLELGGNRIRSLGTGLQSLSALQELWLGKNKITEIGNALHGLRNLRRLSLQANRLTRITSDVFPPDAFPHLEELYLSENDLTCIENVRHLRAMKLIDFSFNPIASIDASEINAETMPQLEDFWLTDGKISVWAEVDKLGLMQKTLRTVYFERNPIEADRRYRDKVYRTLPFLNQIDSWPIVNRHDVESDRAIHRREAPAEVEVA